MSATASLIPEHHRGNALLESQHYKVDLRNFGKDLSGAATRRAQVACAAQLTLGLRKQCGKPAAAEPD